MKDGKRAARGGAVAGSEQGFPESRLHDIASAAAGENPNPDIVDEKKNTFDPRNGALDLSVPAA